MEGNVIVCSGAVIKYHRLGGLDNRHLFLIVLEAEGEGQRSGCRNCLVPREPSFWLADGPLLALLPPGQDESWLVRVLARTLLPSETPRSHPSSLLPKGPIASILTLGVGLPHVNVGDISQSRANICHTNALEQWGLWEGEDI